MTALVLLLLLMVRIWDEETEEVLFDSGFVTFVSVPVETQGLPRANNTEPATGAPQAKATPHWQPAPPNAPPAPAPAAPTTAGSTRDSPAGCYAPGAGIPPPWARNIPPPPGLNINQEVSQWKVSNYAKIQRQLQVQWLSLNAYEKMLGELSPEHPWGATFWEGMASALLAYNWKKYSTEPNGRGYFEPPANFSKEAAKKQKCNISNPGGGKPVAAYIWRYGQGCTEEIWVACQWLLLSQSRPWRVHSSWVQIQEF